MRTLVFDTECYSNFWLVVFKCVHTGEIKRFQLSPNTKLDFIGLNDVLQNYRLVGFNSRFYDIPMLQLALEGYSTQDLKAASDEIIKFQVPYQEFAERHCIERPKHWNTIDLIEVAPLKGSLKIYGGRLHCHKMQDLPIDPDAEVTAEQAKELFTYCCNDLDVTMLLWNELAEQIKLREQLGTEYGQDLRSLSDAQVAERIISAEVAKINGSWPKRPIGLEGKSYKYEAPEYISYQTPQLQAMLERVKSADFTVDNNGAIAMPKELANSSVKIGYGTYRMGIGGLHSSEKCVRYVADHETLLIDNDFNSYYPSIIKEQGLYPEHMGTAFLTVYTKIIEERLSAKGKVGKLKEQLKSLRTQLEYAKRNLPSEG